MLLAGYGAYGYPYPAGFSSNRLSLLDRGVIVAIAHIRGGGELGKRWHDEGRMLNKRNTFTDFIAAAELLVARAATPRPTGWSSRAAARAACSWARCSTCGRTAPRPRCCGCPSWT